ncbi:MAG: Flp pilus assembly protein TadD [Planctomycetota bacterium]|jgi:Flp pilus assembly protein TadD
MSAFTTKPLIHLLLAAFVLIQTSCQVPGTYLEEGSGFADGSGEEIPSPDTLGTLARVLIRRGNLHQAELVYQRLIELHPNFLPAYNELAMLHIGSNHPDEAWSVLNAGLTVAPSDYTLRNNAGILSVLNEDYERAAELFGKLSVDFDDDKLVGCNYALSLGMSGHMEDAAIEYRKHLHGGDVKANLAVIAAAIATPVTP